MSPPPALQVFQHHHTLHRLDRAFDPVSYTHLDVYKRQPDRSCDKLSKHVKRCGVPKCIRCFGVWVHLLQEPLGSAVRYAEKFEDIRILRVQFFDELSHKPM